MKVRIPEPEGFQAFWDIWKPISRHTDGRGLARETFRRHVLNGALPQDIIDGTRWFVRSMKERDREYVPLSSTWLNREAYLDGCEQERSYQARLAEIEAKRTQPAPKPLPEPVRAETEDRAAIMRRVYEKQGLRPPGELH